MSVHEPEQRRYHKPSESTIVNNWLKDVSPEAFGQLRAMLEIDPPRVNINQVEGYQMQASDYDENSNEETTTSVTYADLSSGVAGPTITGLPPGRYRVAFGAAVKNLTSAKETRVSVQTNSDTVIDTDCCLKVDTATAYYGSISREVYKSLTQDGSNTLTLKYDVEGGTGYFKYRWLAAQRIGGL